jgi:hypothetical protein
MTWPTPFAYPSEAHQRKQGPAGYANYEEYKPWLRDQLPEGMKQAAWQADNLPGRRAAL